MSRADILSRLPKAELARIAPDIEQLLQESIRITSHVAGEAQMSVGSSKLGGLPDLPQGTGWPTWKGNPLAFVAQIRLADVSPYQVCSGKVSLQEAQQQIAGDWLAVYKTMPGKWRAAQDPKGSRNPLDLFP